MVRASDGIPVGPADGLVRARSASSTLMIAIRSPPPMKPTKPAGVVAITASTMAIQPIHFGSAP